MQQVAEVVEQPVEIREYHRPLYQCPNCGWSGYSSLPLGVKEGFSYGGRLCSIVGWLGYGGNLTWRKQECLTHFERDLKALETSRFASNREFKKGVSPILHTARTAHQEYHAGQLSLEQLQQLRPILESELAAVLNNLSANFFSGPKL